MEDITIATIRYDDNDPLHNFFFKICIYDEFHGAIKTDHLNLLNYFPTS